MRDAYVLYTRCFPEPYGKPNLKAYYTGGIRTPNPCILWQIHIIM